MAKTTGIKNFKGIQEIIGYQFNNTNILKQALTHSSYSNEKQMSKLYNNERLEFLGDAVLELVSSEYLYKIYPDKPEGELTKIRASLVCEKSLTYSSNKYYIGDYLFLGKGEEATGGRQRPSILSDALEAIIGGIFLDGGFSNAKEFVVEYVLKDALEQEFFYDSKTILQEIIQSEYKDAIQYEVINQEGPDHDKKFTVSIRVNDKEIGIGKGKTKKAAEQEAAHQAILKIKARK